MEQKLFALPGQFFKLTKYMYLSIFHKHFRQILYILQTNIVYTCTTNTRLSVVVKKKRKKKGEHFLQYLYLICSLENGYKLSSLFYEH